MKNLSLTIMAALVLSACGGGSGNESVSTMPTAPTIPNPPVEPTVPSNPQVPSNPTVPQEPVNPSNPTTPTTPVDPTTPTNPVPLPPVLQIGAKVTNVELENIGTTIESNTPFTFGQVFAVGALKNDENVVGKLSDGTIIPLQFDMKSTHEDGSVRHAILSGVVPELAASQIKNMELVKSNANPVANKLEADTLINAGFNASVNIMLDGQQYTASPEEKLKSKNYIQWLSGNIVNEWIVSVPLKNSQGIEHPHLVARFAIRAYNGKNLAKVDVAIENNWTYELAPKNQVYDININIGGQPVYNKTSLNHFHHARWHKEFWWGNEPTINVKHNKQYLIDSKALPNYDTSLLITKNTIDTWHTRWLNSNREPMGNSLIVKAMGTTGGRIDIGLLPGWHAFYLLSQDYKMKNMAVGISNSASSFPIHYRDKNTGYPVTLKSYPYMTILGRPGDTVNPATKKSEAFPACGGDCSTGLDADVSHQPSMSYLPYMVTGDYYHLEELQFWATYNAFYTNPWYRQFGKGLLHSDQIRAQAWGLRTIGQAAYITPDNHPLKSYFNELIDSNLTYYYDSYVVGMPNKLGVLQGVGRYAFGAMVYGTAAGAKTGVAPWQDDFFTSSMGFLNDLGFKKAESILKWKAKFPVIRMTTPGACWIDGANYSMAVRSSETAPLFETMQEIYDATMRNSDGTPLINSTGAKYLDQPCGSQAQANWFTQSDRDNKANRSAWVAGEMTGYASSATGYPSNMQPALAYAAETNIPDADKAWTVFMNRSVKPNYANEPQFAIIPRK